MNIEQARFNMIEQQIRPWDVLDQDVLNLLSIVKRENFVPAAYREHRVRGSSKFRCRPASTCCRRESKRGCCRNWP